MKKIFVLIAVLTAMLLTVGMAHAIVIDVNGSQTSRGTTVGKPTQGVVKVYGVFDYAPGREIVVPFICGKDADNNLNTLFAIGETFADNRFQRKEIVTLHRHVNSVRSAHVYDDIVTLTGYDIFSDDCKTLISKMSNAQKTNLEKTIAGKVYYAGYITFFNITTPNQSNDFAIARDNLISWVYLVDLSKGFAAGMNGLSFQGGIAGALCERDNNGCSTMSWMYPRFYLHNNLADTLNWWLVLSGRNQRVSPPSVMNETRVLGGANGVFCDENENCISLSIPIPDELNIINVSEFIPAGLFRAYPYAGFAVLPYVSNYVDTAVDLRVFDANTTYVGWSYQRAADTAGASLSWSVIHPIHKDY